MSFTNDTLHTAACLWEAALDALETGRKQSAWGSDALSQDPEPFELSFWKYRDNHGIFTTRCTVAELAPRCDAAWEGLSEDEQEQEGCFDLEFAPNWLRQNFFKIIWEGK